MTYVFLFIAANGLSTSEPEAKPTISTGSADFPALTNYRSKSDDETPNEASSVEKTPKETSAVQRAPLLPATTILSSDDAPSTVCGHLQLLFGQMQYSFRRYVTV